MPPQYSRDRAGHQDTTPAPHTR